MDDTLTWLHLSDLHCRDRTGWDARAVLAALRKDLEELAEVEELGPDLIFFTGDAAYGGLDDEFDAAARFFEDVREICGVERENVFLIPGNHDVDRTVIDKGGTAWLEKRRKTHDADAVHEMLRRGKDDERFRGVMKRLDAYRRFLDRAGYEHLLADPARLIYVERREVRGVAIAIAGLNSAWSCHGDDRGRLWLGGAWQFAETAVKLDGADVRVGLVHHPLSWLGDAETGLGSRFERLFDFHLHGHEHDDWATQLTGDGHVRVAGGACYDRSDRDNGYNLVRLDFENEMGEVWLRRFESKVDAWQRREMVGKTDAQGVFHLQAGRWCERRRAKDDVTGLSGERLVDEVFDALRQDEVLKSLDPTVRTIPASAVEAAFQSFAVQDALEGWKGMGDEEESRLDRAVVYATIERESFTLSELLESLEGHGADVDPELVERSLKRLELAWVVGTAGASYFYRVPLFVERVRTQGPSSLLAREVAKLGSGSGR